MTIRDNGGVFGRNPSFNNVTASDLISTNVEIPQGGKLHIGNGAGPGALPRGDLEIYHDGSNSRIDEVFAGNLIIRAHDQIQFGGYVSGKNFIIMQDGGAVSLWHNGSSKLQTASTGVSVTGNVIVASGNGIDFSATAGTGTSELFDDYEEGTWTPTLNTDNVGFTSVSYASNVGGLYTKMGRFVFVQGFMSTTAVTVGSASGTVAIGGLPFNVVANSSGLVDAYGGATIARSDSWTTNNPSAGTCVPGTNLIYLYYRGAANGGTTFMPVSSVATGSGNNLFFTGLYVTA